MLELIRHVGHDLGMDVILSSHLLEEVERVSDAVVILDAGVVVAGGSLAELRGGRDRARRRSRRRGGVVRPAHRRPRRRRRAARSVGPGRVLVALADPGVYDTVRDALAAAGSGVRRLHARTASLEEVYLEAADHGRANL